MSSQVRTRVYKSIPLSDSLGTHSDGKQASHCMLYSTPDSNGISYVLLQMRFDGLIGFAGGEVDVEDVTIDAIIETTNRELEEEISYYFEGVTENDWICTHRDISGQFVQHFFAKELKFEQILHLSTTHMNAEHFPYESLGVFLVPIGNTEPNSLSAKFVGNFLQQKFAGNAKNQFLSAIKKRKLLSDKQLRSFESNIYVTENGDNNGVEVKALLRTELPVEYHGKTANVTYGLMIIRDNGLFDFVGTDFVDDRDKDLMVRTLNDSLKRDLGSFNEICVSESDSIELSSDDYLSHVFHINLNGSEFTKIETNFTESENFKQTSFGLIRIPIRFQVNDSDIQDSDIYIKKFFDGFLKQNFVNNSRNQLKSIFDNFEKYF